jgi:hypothetical protein
MKRKEARRKGRKNYARDGIMSKEGKKRVSSEETLGRQEVSRMLA